MKRNRKKILFHLLGSIAVAFWLVMLSLLVKKVHFPDLVVEENRDASRLIDSAEREWKEIYLKERKVGYAVNLIKPFGEGYFLQEEIFLKLNLAGLGSAIHSYTHAQVDKRFNTKSFQFVMTSGVVRFSISGRLEGDHFVINAGNGGGAKAQRLDLRQVPMLGAGVGYFLRSVKIRVGESFRLPLFDPATMSQKEAVIKVAGKEPLKLNNFTYDAYRLEAELWGKPMTLWVDEKGVILKEQGFLGLTVVKSSAARARANMEGDGEIDLYEISAVLADRPLRDPSRLRYLKVKMEGIDPRPFYPMGMQGGRQQMEEGILTIRKEEVPTAASTSLYAEHSADMRPFLEPEFNIESDDPQIIQKAREIAGNDRDPIKVARKLLQWVYDHLEKKPILSVPSALETLRTKVGDCNEHATLLTAFLRASGIPARLSIGLVYTREKFFYHAWTEAHVGSWISMDATLNQMPVDASHIRFLEGNLAKQVEMTKVIGELKMSILDFEHD